MKRKIEQLLNDRETVFNELNLKDGMALRFSKDHGVWIDVFSDGRHSFTSICERIDVTGMTSMEIEKMIEQTRSRYRDYSEFMKEIGFDTLGNGLYCGFMGTRIYTVRVKFRDDDYIGIHLDRPVKRKRGELHPPIEWKMQCRTKDLKGFMLFFLELKLPLEELMKLPSEIRDMISSNTFNPEE